MQRPGYADLVAAPEKEPRAPRARMTGSERRHQLIDIARSLFAERGYEGTSIEEIAQRANVSKPVVYEHFGGKEGLYAVVVDREMSALLDGITVVADQQPLPGAGRAGGAGAADLRRGAHRRLPDPDPRLPAVASARAPTPACSTTPSARWPRSWPATSPAAAWTRNWRRCTRRRWSGSVSMTAQWWLDAREPKKEVVAAHLVNLMWNGLTPPRGRPAAAGRVVARRIAARRKAFRCRCLE